MSCCTADFLRLDGSSSDDIDKLAIDELFEVIFMPMQVSSFLELYVGEFSFNLLYFIFVGCFKRK